MRIMPDRLKDIRTAKGLTTKKLGEKARLDHRSIQRLESSNSSQKTTRESTIKKMADALGVEFGVLTGDLPIPKLDRVAQKIGNSRQLSAYIDQQSYNSYSLVSAHYGVNPSDIVAMAPLFFTLLAEGSLESRRQKIRELDAHIASVRHMAVGHLSFAMPHRAEDGSFNEHKSIADADIFGKNVSDDAWELGYQQESENPFIQYLKTLASEFDSDSIVDIDEDAYGSEFPEGGYRVCFDRAKQIADGNEELAEAISEGWIDLGALPKNLKQEDALKARVKWLLDQLEEHNKKSAKWLEDFANSI